MAQLENAKDEMMKNINAEGDVEFGKVGVTDFIAILRSKIAQDLAALSDKDLDFTDIYHLGNDGNLIVLAGVVVVTILMIVVIHQAIVTEDRPKPVRVEDVVVDDEREPPRDFTLSQLREFDGKANKKIYVALKGDVYDVSASAEYYGPGSTYDCFAGRDASRAMAKLSFEEAELSNPNLDDLGPFERDVLENWVEKFKYMKAYPIVGRLSYPRTDRTFTAAELWACRGYRECSAPTEPSTRGDEGQASADQHAGAHTTTNGKHTAASHDPHSTAPSTPAVVAASPPEGRVHAEILICVKGKVLDVSYGGVDMYGVGGPYQRFAGGDRRQCVSVFLYVHLHDLLLDCLPPPSRLCSRSGLDISRALAKMSFAPEDLSSTDLTGLTSEQLKILDDWEEKFEVKKKYPVVGRMRREPDAEPVEGTTGESEAAAYERGENVFCGGGVTE